MRPISEFFLAERPEVATGEVGSPDTMKTTPTYTRVAQEELELAYSLDPIIFNGINSIVRTIMSYPAEIVCEDKQVEEYFKNFTKNIGKSGSDITWEELLAAILTNTCVGGKAYVENVFNKKKNRIVDWDIIDTKTMDYAKDATQKIVFDQSGKPVGYFQVIPYGDGNGLVNKQQEKVLPPRVSVPANGRSVFLNNEQVAQIKLYSIGSGLYPIGLVEPIYKMSVRKMNIEASLSQAIQRHGFPIIVAKLGDLNHEPTPNQINGMLDKLKNINFKQEIAVPYYYDLQIMESKKAEKMKEHLDYFQSQEIAGMGVPSPFVTGSSDGATMASMEIQGNMFHLSLKDILNRVTTGIEKYMFAPVCKYEGFKTVPKLKWGDVSINELDAKAKRIEAYIRAGLLVPDDKLKDFVKRSENL